MRTTRSGSRRPATPMARPGPAPGELRPVDQINPDPAVAAVDDVAAADPAAADPTADSDAREVTAWGLLVEVYAAGNRLLEADLVKRHGIPLTWFEVLLRLSRSPDGQQRISALADQVSFSSGGFTRLADRLASAGLVERRQCPTDRRGALLALTDTGHSLITAATASQARVLREHVLACLPADSRHEWEAATRRLRDALDPQSRSRPSQPG